MININVLTISINNKEEEEDPAILELKKFDRNFFIFVLFSFGLVSIGGICGIYKKHLQEKEEKKTMQANISKPLVQNILSFETEPLVIKKPRLMYKVTVTNKIYFYFYKKPEYPSQLVDRNLE